MGTKASTVEFLLEQLGPAVTAKKMFGEYGLYLDGKMFALVCDDQLFVKLTPAGKELLGEVEEGPPYPGAKNAFIIPGERWDDAAWLAELAKHTARELPDPQQKRAAKRPAGAAAFSARGGKRKPKPTP
jgi:TfoX/Sxy family transcriptional regulator of competence genes